jgi:hypothetical protein
MPARGAAEPQRIGTFTRAQRRSRGSQPTMGELRLHGAVRRDPRTMAHADAVAPRARGGKSRQHRPLASIARGADAAPDVQSNDDNESANKTKTREPISQRVPTNPNGRSIRESDAGDVGGSTPRRRAREARAARHREAAGNTIASRHCPIGDRRAASATGANSRPCRPPRPEKAETAAGCLLASGDERRQRLSYPQDRNRQQAGCPRLGESVWPLLGLGAADVSGRARVLDDGWIMDACVRGCPRRLSTFESASISVMMIN